MIKACFTSESKARSLTAKIRAAEQHLLIRQGVVGVHTDALIKKIHQQVTAPSTLLLTVGIGFIIGELTKHRISNNHAVDNKHHNKGTSPLKTALNLMASVHTLYTALPIAWIIKSFHQATEQGQSQSVPAASGASGNRRRSRR